MGRLYSRSACMTCKARKKKCDEEKPICKHCTRLKLKCTYNPKESGHRNTQNLAEEARIVQRVPTTAQTFLSPACDFGTSALQIVWQFMYEDELVRNALVACFSNALGQTQEHGALNRRCYGKSLQLLQTRMLDKKLTKTDTLKMMIAVQFLGLLDTVGSEEPADVLQHWKALATLVAYIQPFMRDEISRASIDLNIFQYEGLAYHVTLSIFCSDVQLIRTLWRKARVFEVLRSINCGDDNDGLIHSPFLYGQYQTFELILEVTYLHRVLAKGHINAWKITQVEDKLLDAQKVVEAVVIPGLSRSGCSDKQAQSIVAICKLHTNALRMMVKALQPTKQSVQDIDESVEDSIHVLAKMDNTYMCYATLTWPLHILLLGLRNNEQVKLVNRLTEDFQATLDPGHKRRFEAVMFVIQQSFEKSETQHEHKSEDIVAQSCCTSENQLVIKQNSTPNLDNASVIEDTDELRYDNSQMPLMLSLLAKLKWTSVPPGMLLLQKADGILS